MNTSMPGAVACPRCGLTVEVSGPQVRKADIDFAVFAQTCQRIDELPAFSVACPDLQRAINEAHLPKGGSMSYVPEIVIAGCIATVVTMLVGDWFEDRR